MSIFTFGSDAAATLQALGHSLAVIEFNTNGTILNANENFCGTFGYSMEELKGQHHSLFCDPAFVKSPAYKALWEKLARGEYDAQEYKRIAKGGREVWIQASYNPVRSRSGKVQKVVKIAADITPQKLRAISDAGQLSAIHRAQAVIEFTVEGVILDANENFCKTLGFTVDEIRGRHHRMFCEPAYAQSPDYVAFWKKLARGEFDAREYKRIGNGGKEVWIQASYNPIFDTDGKVVKVVKFATDVTDRVKAVDALASALSQLAAGNLDQQLTLPFPPALEQLRADFNASVQSLHGVVSQVGQTAHAVETGTGEIREASSNLSKRTEQQAASLEETAAALEEITATVKKTAEGTRQAHTAIGDAKSGAERSGQVVEKAVAAMSSIESSSREVNQIIGVIDEIAFQTNLLALNAGVEAARAGDAGRGFAVVASEVRALAQRSAEAAKQIKELILQSTTHVATGVDLVASTGRALQEIIGQVNQVAGVIGDINAAASEQATSLGQVNTAINQLDQITQQNAAMVEQSSAASTAINDKARELNTLLSRFALGTPAKPMAAMREVAHLKPMRRSEPARRTKGGARAAPTPLIENEWTDF